MLLTDEHGRWRSYYKAMMGGRTVLSGRVKSLDDLGCRVSSLSFATSLEIQCMGKQKFRHMRTILVLLLLMGP